MNKEGKDGESYACCVLGTVPVLYYSERRHPRFFTSRSSMLFVCPAFSVGEQWGRCIYLSGSGGKLSLVGVAKLKAAHANAHPSASKLVGASFLSPYLALVAHTHIHRHWLARRRKHVTRLEGQWVATRRPKIVVRVDATRRTIEFLAAREPTLIGSTRENKASF